MKKKWIGRGLVGILLPIVANAFLQWTQNIDSPELVGYFIVSWHTEKFLLGCLLLAVIWLFWVAFVASFLYGSLFFTSMIGLIGFINYQKVIYRGESLYPDDFQMIAHLSMLKDSVGTLLFSIVLALIIFIMGLIGWRLYRSLFLSWRQQRKRVALLAISTLLVGYSSQFNKPSNLFRKAFNRTALWVPYSQQMNYYNVGFLGGFLYNLHITAMDTPNNYSKQTIQTIVKKYEALAAQYNKEIQDEKPNIIYVMGESFSDPSRLKGVELSEDPLTSYRELANRAYSNQMLSANYGGGTANIEFEGLTGFSMGLMTGQMTTPYTQLMPKLKELPSIVSFLEQQAYQTTAIHPYDSSMYRRKTVYPLLGFQDFMDESRIANPQRIEGNPYISDETVYQQIIEKLKQSQQPQFIHLVTMQMHMPFGHKYTQTEYQAIEMKDDKKLADYAQDTAYSSQSLAQFAEQLDQLERPTILVFWGDHLPSIYSKTIRQQNTAVDLHLTEYLMYNTRQNWANQSTPLSPFYFASTLLTKAKLPISGFYSLLTQLQMILPAFEKEMYYYQGNWQKTLSLTKEQQNIFDEYRLIQYDILQGKQYSHPHFFELVT